MLHPQTRMTRQRAVILEELKKMRTHPTADEVYSVVRKRLPRISLGTVYRNLDFLAKTGVILKLEASGIIKRFDGETSMHQHVRCTRCGKIGDVMPPLPTPEFVDVQVEGFTITTARVEYDGICAACAQKMPAEAGEKRTKNAPGQEYPHF